MRRTWRHHHTPRELNPTPNPNPEPQTLPTGGFWVGVRKTMPYGRSRGAMFVQYAQPSSGIRPRDPRARGGAQARTPARVASGCALLCRPATRYWLDVRLRTIADHPDALGPSHLNNVPPRRRSSMQNVQTAQWPGGAGWTMRSSASSWRASQATRRTKRFTPSGVERRDRAGRSHRPCIIHGHASGGSSAGACRSPSNLVKGIVCMRSTVIRSSASCAGGRRRSRDLRSAGLRAHGLRWSIARRRRIHAAVASRRCRPSLRVSGET